MDPEHWITTPLAEESGKPRAYDLMAQKLISPRGPVRCNSMEVRVIAPAEESTIYRQILSALSNPCLQQII